MTEQATEEHQGLPCIVRHPDAGGQCWRPEAMKVHGLGFCEVHGPEARIDALSEAAHEAQEFFERLRNPHVSPLSAMVRQGLEAALSGLWLECDEDVRYEEALLTAYPPEAVPE